MPQIYVHIGLPKTATTTLQTQAFQGHSRWEYLGTRLPRFLNTDPDFRLLEAWVQRGEGSAMAVQEALMLRHKRAGKPLMVSEENFSIGAFAGYPPRHAFSQSRHQKLDRLCAALDGMKVCILVSLRPFAKAVFSAYVEYQEQWQKGAQDVVELVSRGDAMGMYRYRQLRADLEARWPGSVVPIAFEDVVQGRVSFPGFTWHSKTPVPNTRQHPRVEGGVVREVVSKRPLLPLAQIVAPWAPRLAIQMWGVRSSRRVTVPYWGEEVWAKLSALETESDRAREEWLARS